MIKQRLSDSISEALARGATLIVPTAQRQAAVRAAWAEQQRAAGQRLWTTPRVFTFNQFAESLLGDQWAARQQPDRLLPAGAEWALMRELRRQAGTAEARALLNAIRTLHDWGIPRTTATLAGAPEGELLMECLSTLEARAAEQGRRPLRDWLDEITTAGELRVAGWQGFPAAQQATLRRLGAESIPAPASLAHTRVVMAQDDDDELALIAAWCRGHLDQDPGRRLLIVDAKLRQRRRQYERVLSQTLSPSEWLANRARDFSQYFAIEGGQPLGEFPLVAHAVLTLRLLAGGLRFDEVLLWLRMPFLDVDDDFAGAVHETVLRESGSLEYTAASLCSLFEQSAPSPSRALAARLRTAQSLLSGERRAAPEWAQRLLAALRAAGWPGSRALRSDEQQTVARLHALLDEFSGLGAWLPPGDAGDAVATLADMARERSFDPASVAAPVALTDSHDDPIVHYDGIWVAGLDAAQWPAPPRPDAFIPLRLQVAAGIPTASAAAQARQARMSFEAWQSATPELMCSWAALDGDVHRARSPLLSRVAHADESPLTLEAAAPLVMRLRTSVLEPIEDTRGLAVDTTLPVRGGVKPLNLQAECGFHAYAEMRLGAERLEDPQPGIDPRVRGELLHKALELVWGKLDANFLTLSASDASSRGPAITHSVQAAVTHVFRGRVPPDLRQAVEREVLRLERLIEALFKLESRRALESTFHVECLEVRRDVHIAGGTFEVRIDRIDSLQGGGFAILDYKSGTPGTLRWDDPRPRNPQLLAYLLAERGRDVQALANVALTRGRARFMGKASRRGLLPGVSGMTGMIPGKVPAEQIDAAWHSELDRWQLALQALAAEYLAGDAPAQPSSDVCRHCHLTVLCRRVELTAAGLSGGESIDE